MKVYILGKEYKFDRSVDEIEDIVDTIYKESNKKGYHYAYAEVDGVEIYTNLIEYMENNLHDIKVIKVETMTLKEMTKSSISNIRNYIMEEKVYLPHMAEDFKKGIEDMNSKELESLIEGIGWIIEYFYRIDSTENLSHIIPDYYVWNTYAKDIIELESILKKLHGMLLLEEYEDVGVELEEKLLPNFKSMKEKLDILCDIKNDEDVGLL